MTLYFIRFWNESTGEPLTDSWGTSTNYFETDLSGKVLRQLEVYANGRKLKYDSLQAEDEYGGLSKVPLDLVEFNKFKTDQQDFENIWRS